MNSSSPVWHVDLTLRPSRFFLALTLLLHGATLAAVMLSGLSMTWQGGLGFCLVISLVGSWRQELTKEGLVLKEQRPGRWLYSGRRQGQAKLMGRQVWRYLVVMDLQCRDEQGAWRQRVVVLPDAVPADTFRRLRVRLLHGRGVRQQAEVAK